jgi:hypothetical protein
MDKWVALQMASLPYKLTAKQPPGALYTARHNPDPKQLQIISPWSSSSGVEKPREARLFRRRALKKTFTNFTQTLELNDQPLHRLLGRFGSVIPQRQRQYLTGHLTPSSIAPIRHDDERIEVSLLCFHTLSKVANIKIEWVDISSLHLEFDSYTKVLKVFRLPSFCLLMCSCEKVSPLSQCVPYAKFGKRQLGRSQF